MRGPAQRSTLRGYRAFGFVIATALLAGGAGCSLLVDTSGLVGDAVPDDAASDRASAGEAATPDAADAGADADASSPNDAAKAYDATFCDDFDDGPLGATWTRKMLAGGGTLELATPAKSMPSALRAKFYGVSSPADRYALLEKDLGLGKSVRCDFDIFVNHRPNMDIDDVFRIRTRGPGVGDYILYFAVTTGGGALADDIAYPDGGCACPQKYVPFTQLREATWSHVTVETDFSTASVTVDGTVVVSGTFGPIVPNEPIVVGLGGRAFSSITSDVSFDDFSCTLTP